MLLIDLNINMNINFLMLVAEFQFVMKGFNKDKHFNSQISMYGKE